MPMLDLKIWLRAQGLSASELAGLLEVPLSTVEGWVYQRTQPKPENLDLINNFITAACAHHWVIDVPNGPLSEGECKRCGEKREFTNSAEPTAMWNIASRPKAQ